jgi:hypothetical protein
METLHLYNRGFPCGAKAISNHLDQEGVKTLPSMKTIKRSFSRKYLTYGRIGYSGNNSEG